MEKGARWRRSLWVLGGLALGGLAALVLGVLVFWVQPTVRRAKSPVGEYLSPPFVLRYVKSSSIASHIPDLAGMVQQEWTKIVDTLGLQSHPFPENIYLYLYASPQELSLGIAARTEEEATPMAIADLLVPERVRGILALLACSLALGRPGNAIFPRGLALCLDEPERDWQAEAGAWISHIDPKRLWQNPRDLLPRDLWEELYFQVDAPWVGITPTWEALHALLQGLEETERGKGRVWEVLAAAQAQWALQAFGARGVRAFWLASSWEQAATALMVNADGLWADFQEDLQKAFAENPNSAYYAALRDLYLGRAEAALWRLRGLEGEEVRQARALAWLALGEPARFCQERGECPVEIQALSQAPRHQEGRWLAVGEDITPSDLKKAAESAHRLLAIWEADETILPERIVFYMVTSVPDIETPWNVVWVSEGPIQKSAARLVLEALSPWESPDFPVLSEGLVLWAAEPGRDFRKEAKTILAQGRWVSLAQPLFGVYPRPLAEAEAGAFVSFLLEEYGPSGVRRLWEALVQGASIFRASQEVFGLSWYDLEAALQEWIKRP